MLLFKQIRASSIGTNNIQSSPSSSHTNNNTLRRPLTVQMNQNWINSFDFHSGIFHIKNTYVFFFLNMGFSFPILRNPLIYTHTHTRFVYMQRKREKIRLFFLFFYRKIILRLSNLSAASTAALLLLMHLQMFNLVLHLTLATTCKMAHSLFLSLIIPYTTIFPHSCWFFLWKLFKNRKNTMKKVQKTKKLSKQTTLTYTVYYLAVCTHYNLRKQKKTTFI